MSVSYTPHIHLYLLASGSKGNATVVEGPDGSILVDCGLSRRELHRRADLAGCDLSRVQAVLITHEHSDHVKGLPVVAKHFAGPIFATRATMRARSTLQDIPFTQFTCGDAFDIAGMHLQTFALSHDVADPVGYRFEVRDSGDTLDAAGWATDTGVLTGDASEVLRGCRILGIESNHDPDMLATGPYPGYLKARVGGRHGHLSNLQAAQALPQLVGSQTQVVVAMHISEKNNTPNHVRKALEGCVSGATLRLAPQDEPLVVW